MECSPRTGTTAETARRSHIAIGLGPACHVLACARVESGAGAQAPPQREVLAGLHNGEHAGRRESQGRGARARTRRDQGEAGAVESVRELAASAPFWHGSLVASARRPAEALLLTTTTWRCRAGRRPRGAIGGASPQTPPSALAVERAQTQRESQSQQEPAPRAGGQPRACGRQSALALVWRAGSHVHAWGRAPPLAPASRRGSGDRNMSVAPDRGSGSKPRMRGGVGG